MHQEHSVIVQVVQVGLSPRHFTHKLSHWSNWKLTQSSGSFLPLLLRVSPSVTLRSPLKMSGFGNRSSGFGRGRGGDEYSDGMCTYDMFVPAGDCGKIIGRQGTKIRELQDQSRCRIKVSRDDEGDGTRRVELSGSDDAIAEAKELINQILESDDRGGARQSYDGVSGGGGGGGSGGGGGGGGSGSSKEVIQIDSSFVGRIIGKGGSRVRELQDDTGCRINVSRDGGNYGQTDVELIGSRFAIQRAREAIDEITSQAY